GDIDIQNPAQETDGIIPVQLGYLDFDSVWADGVGEMNLFRCGVQSILTKVDWEHPAPPRISQPAGNLRVAGRVSPLDAAARRERRGVIIPSEDLAKLVVDLPCRIVRDTEARMGGIEKQRHLMTICPVDKGGPEILLEHYSIGNSPRSRHIFFDHDWTGCQADHRGIL